MLQDGPFRLLASAVRTPDQTTGAVDLLSAYGLKSAYEALCTKPIPDFIDNSRCFKSVVGDTTIRRGDGMELAQLVDRQPPAQPLSVDRLQPFSLEALRSAFTFRETAPVQLQESEKGVATECVKTDDKEKGDGKKHKKKHKKRKHRHKDKEKGKEVVQEGGVKKANPASVDGEDHSKKHHKKKRKHENEVSAKK